MLTSEFDFNLPKELIAQFPCAERDKSRLMVLHRADGRIEHKRFDEVVSFLSPPDVLVLNDTRVIPAKLYGRRATSGRVEMLLVNELQEDLWEVLLKGRRKPEINENIILEDGELNAVVKRKGGEGTWVLEFTPSGAIREFIGRKGYAPLPPYIKRKPDDGYKDYDLARYQTVYACHPGSIAAPTAGFHFTENLLERIKASGVQIVFITLHVGAGTFKPIQSSSIEEHQMLGEYYRVPAESLEAILRAKERRGRVIAVGTTCVRTLETVARSHREVMLAVEQKRAARHEHEAGKASHLENAVPVEAGTSNAVEGWTNLFIYPPFEFKLVDAIITNFHLPQSTNLALVCAFAGIQMTLDAYAEAVRQKYRFYSYGDAMLVI